MFGPPFLTVAALLIAVAQSVVTENFKLSPVRGVVTLADYKGALKVL